MVSTFRSSTTINKVSVYLCKELRDLDKRPSKQLDAIPSRVSGWNHVSGNGNRAFISLLVAQREPRLMK